MGHFLGGSETTGLAMEENPRPGEVTDRPLRKREGCHGMFSSHSLSRHITPRHTPRMSRARYVTSHCSHYLSPRWGLKTGGTLFHPWMPQPGPNIHQIHTYLYLRLLLWRAPCQQICQAIFLNVCNQRLWTPQYSSEPSMPGRTLMSNTDTQTIQNLHRCRCYQGYEPTTPWMIYDDVAELYWTMELGFLPQVQEVVGWYTWPEAI